MFASYLFSRNHQYAPLPLENKAEIPASKPNQTNRRRTFIQALIVLEIIHLLIVLIAYAGGRIFEHTHTQHELDTCWYYLTLEYVSSDH